MPQNPKFSHEEYDRFSLNETNDGECLAEFRFWQHDLQFLSEVLQIRDSFRCYQRSVVDGMEGLCILLRRLKGHSQLMHMRYRYHFLADLHITRHACETESEKCIRNTLNKACRGELVTSRIRHYRLKPYQSTHFFIYGWEFTDGFVLGKPDIDKYFQIQTSVEVRNDSNHCRRFKVEKAWFSKFV